MVNQRGYRFDIITIMAKLIDNVAPFDITEVAHPAHEFLAKRVIVRGSRSDVSDARGFARLLRLRRERPRGRRAAWLRIFVVRYSLPCDPPVGGHSCNGGMIPGFHRAVCDKGRIIHPQRSMRVEHGHEYSPRYMHGSLAVPGSII